MTETNFIGYNVHEFLPLEKEDNMIVRVSYDGHNLQLDNDIIEAFRSMNFEQDGSGYDIMADIRNLYFNKNIEDIVIDIGG